MIIATHFHNKKSVAIIFYLACVAYIMKIAAKRSRDESGGCKFNLIRISKKSGMRCLCV